jgi:hypothetical protein
MRGDMAISLGEGVKAATSVAAKAFTNQIPNTAGARNAVAWFDSTAPLFLWRAP